MERIEVKSSALRAIAYDPATQTLEVVFPPTRSGVCVVWRYEPVPQSLVEQMLAEGASVGTVFHRAIKTSPLIEARRVGEEPA